MNVLCGVPNERIAYRMEAALHKKSICWFLNIADSHSPIANV